MGSPVAASVSRLALTTAYVGTLEEVPLFADAVDQIAVLQQFDQRHVAVGELREDHDVELVDVQLRFREVRARHLERLDDPVVARRTCAAQRFAVTRGMC